MTTTENGNPNISPRRARRLGGALRALSLILLALAMAWCQAALAQRGATAVATVTNGSVAGVMVTDGGSGYAAPPTVTFVGGGGTGASATAQASGGAVTAIIIQTAGMGYTSAPVVAIDPPPPTNTPAALSLSLIPKVLITGQAWAVEEIQYADALGGTNQWFTLTNIVLGNDPYVLIDTSVPQGGRRFYQVVTLAAPGPDPALALLPNVQVSPPKNSPLIYPEPDSSFTHPNTSHKRLPPRLSPTGSLSPEEWPEKSKAALSVPSDPHSVLHAIRSKGSEMDHLPTLLQDEAG